MPRKPPPKRPAKSAASRPKKPRDPLVLLAQQPRQSNLTITGGWRTLQAMLEDEQGNPVHAQVVFWADMASHTVYGSGIVPLERSADGGASEAIDILIEGLQKPGAGDDDMAAMLRPDVPPGLPGKIVVADPPLAVKLSARFAPYHVTVENADDLPEMDELLGEMLESLGFGPNGEPPPPFAWDLPQETATMLYAAAAKLWKRAPWDLLLEYPPVEITLGANGPAPEVPVLYASVISDDESMFGVTFFYAADGYEALLNQSMPEGDQQARYDEIIQMMREQGLPVDMIPPPLLQSMIDAALGEDAAPSFEDVAQDALTCFYANRAEVDRTYLAWMDARGVRAPAKKAVPNFSRTLPGQQPHQPDEREARALALALDALAQFCTHFKAQLDAGEPPPAGVPLEMTAHVAGIAIPVSYTPEDEEDVFEEELDEEGEDEREG